MQPIGSCRFDDFLHVDDGTFCRQNRLLCNCPMIPSDQHVAASIGLLRVE